ncbi:DNA-directed RNA polymerase [Labrys neptuniae]
MSINHPRFADQLALEEEMRGLGINRFRERLKEAKEAHKETETLAVRRLLGSTHAAMVEGVEEFLAEANSGKPGRRHTAAVFLNAIDDVDIVAHLTCRSVLDSISQREKIAQASVNLSTLIEDELHFRAFRQQDEKAYKSLHFIASKTSNERRRRNVMLIPARKAGVQFDDWSKEDKVKVGEKLIEIFCLKTGYATVRRASEGATNTPNYVEGTAETLAWIKSEHARCEWMTPVYLPTIVPPKPWTTPFDGGYWSGRVRKLTLVKSPNRQYLNELAERDMPMVYDSTNAHQETAWRINTRVLDVMKEFWAAGSTIGKLPSQKTKEEIMPERPDWLAEDMQEEDMTEDQKALFKSWKRELARGYSFLAKNAGKLAGFERLLFVANRFRNEEEFYFPHQLDWRGRAYPATLYLHPQGNDTSRGILEFANSVPLTDDDGVNWLAIHGAGLWGVDKVNMDERIAWVETNEERILASAEDPFEHRFWTEAEKPWSALAFCYEWAGWKREGYAFESHISPQMDGTCNGLQNFSAILRDPIGGAAVNLVPSDKPKDIYDVVAKRVAARVEADLDNQERIKLNRKDENGKAIVVDGPTIASIAQAWHGHINRKVTKRPVMTLAYGAKLFGFKEQVFEDTVAPWKRDKPEEFPFEGTGWQAADYMGGLIWDEVQQVVVAAAQAMEWLQKAASVAAKEGLPVLWTTPTGFLVQQAYRAPKMKRLELTFDKVRIQIAIEGEGPSPIDVRKQASGISPNWVHSLDASHMARTVARCRALGIKSFSFIHDSYGTHAGNAALLAQVLREEFVAMYQENVLERFRTELTAQLPPGVELDPIPPMGTLDLNLVLESPFFFA